MHSEISGCLVNSSRDLFSNILSPTLATNEVGKHTVELLNLFLNPRSSDADFDNLICKWVTCQVLVSISNPLISPRSNPPAQITNFPESLSKLTKVNHHYSIIKIRNIFVFSITDEARNISNDLLSSWLFHVHQSKECILKLLVVKRWRITLVKIIVLDLFWRFFSISAIYFANETNESEKCKSLYEWIVEW